MSTNVLKGARVYLAGNVETDTEAVSWRGMVRERLGRRGIIILSPTEPMFVEQPAEDEEFARQMKSYKADPDKAHEVMSRIIAQDLRMIDICDFCIVRLKVQKPAFGTMHELVVATQQKKPVFLNWPDKTNIPRWFTGLLKPNYIYETLEDILTKIEDIDNGTVKIDAAKWRLLLPELRGI